jgi:hypothetical protein
MKIAYNFACREAYVVHELRLCQILLCYGDEEPGHLW